jgi:hypothetical protein
MTVNRITLSAVQGAVRNRYAVALDTSYSTCGNALGRCTNNWRCVQRQGAFKQTCPRDLCTVGGRS